MRKIIALLILLFQFGSPTASAQQFVHPSPNLSPEQVVEVQLKSLQNNDDPVPDHGIQQTWIFAHPSNKAMTGPLARFTLMIRSPNYETMIGHRARTIEKVVQTDTIAQFSVTIETRDGEKRAFQWIVQKVDAGPHTGSWMTISVSPPLLVGNST